MLWNFRISVNKLYEKYLNTLENNKQFKWMNELKKDPIKYKKNKIKKYDQKRIKTEKKKS